MLFWCKAISFTKQFNDLLDGIVGPQNKLQCLDYFCRKEERTSLYLVKILPIKPTINLD
jgi:hypothetical protein